MPPIIVVPSVELDLEVIIPYGGPDLLAALQL